MTTPFSKTIRSLDREPNALTSVTLAVFIGFLAAWVAVAAFVPVPVRLTTIDARLIAAAKPMPLHAQSTLPVERVLVDIGDFVSRGDLLVEFYAGELRVNLTAAKQRLAAFRQQHLAIQEEHRTSGEFFRQQQTNLEGERDRITARLTKAASELAWLEAEHRRLNAMAASGAVSRRDLQKSATDIDKASALMAEERATLASIEALLRANLSQADMEQARLDREAAEIAADIAEQQGIQDGLSERLTQAELRAPVDGVVGSMEMLGPGTSVAATDWLLTVVPDSGYEVEARFDSRALGQLRLGQAGWLRLDSFPWANYGLVPTTLVRLSNERQGREMTARFRIGDGIPPEIPLQHGLEGELEVEVRRVPIAELLLEVIGQFRSG